MAIRSPLEKSMTIPSAPIWRLTVEQYHQMIDAGILTDDDPVELLEGWLVTKMPKKPPHTLTTQLTGDILREVLPGGWFINVQEPITLATSEPEPDVVIVRGDRRDYRDRHPYPAEIALVVEVADATLQRDKTLKLRVYASGRVLVYWVLNLQDRQLEIYSNPAGDGEQAVYQQQQIYQPDEQAAVELDGQEIARLRVSNLFA